MNKWFKRGLSAALALTLAVSLLAGCTETGGKDPVQEMMGEESGVTSDTVMLTVNGSEITAGDLFFWLSQSAEEAASYTLILGEESLNWDADAGDGMTLAEYVKKSAVQQAVLYNVVAAKARENGYELTKEDKEAYEAELAQAKEDLGGDEVYRNWLATHCLTEEGMEKLSAVGVLYDHMLEGMFRDGGEYAPTDEDLMTFAAENDYLYAKHILLMTKDTATNEPLPAEEIAARREKAEEMLAQLKAIQDPEEQIKAFDELMNQNSEDTGLAVNPDGYLFTAGQMVAPFEEATRALDFGQISDIVETDYGIHIILRLDPVTCESLRSEWARNELDRMVDQWIEEAEVEETEEFTSLEIATFYEKLKAYQDLLAAAQETGEAAPAGDQAVEIPAEGTQETEPAQEAEPAA